MALTLSTANGYQVVTGVYEGQGTSAIRIGQVSQTFGGSNNPLVVGFTQLDDHSYTIKAFFDPSLSLLTQNQSYEQICFIQVSDFFINNYLVPYQLKDIESPCLFTDRFNPISHAPELLKWVNIPALFNNPSEKLLFPEYPLWTLQEDPQLTLQQLYKYPQLYGGYTNYNPAGIGRKGNDNLCAYMNLEAALSYEGLPVDFNNQTYFNTLDFSTLAGVAIPANVPFKANYIRAYLIIAGIVPSKTNIKETQTVSGKPYFLVEYQSYAKKGNRSMKSNTSLAVWQDKKKKIYYAVLDDDLQEEWHQAQMIYGRPDLEVISKKLHEEYGYDVVNLSLNGFRLSLRYDTYACAVAYDTNTKLYQLNVFDSFRIELIKQYSYVINGNEQWLNTTLHTEVLTDTDVQQFLNTTQAFLDYQNPGSKLVRYL